MQKVAVPVLAPGACAVCRQAHQDGLEWVDTLRELEAPVVIPENGRIYLCSRCVIAAGAVLGLRPSAAVEESLLAVELAERRVDRLRALAAEARELLSVESLDRAEGRATIPAEAHAAAREAAEKLPRLPVAEEKPARAPRSK